MIIVLTECKSTQTVDIVPVASLLEGAEALDEQVFAALFKLLVNTDGAGGVDCRFQIGIFSNNTIVEVDLLFIP